MLEDLLESAEFDTQKIDMAQLTQASTANLESLLYTYLDFDGKLTDCARDEAYHAIILELNMFPPKTDQLSVQTKTHLYQAFPGGWAVTPKNNPYKTTKYLYYTFKELQEMLS